MSSVRPLILEDLSLVKSYALRLTIAQGIFKDLATSPMSVADVSASLGGHKLGNLLIDYLSELGYLDVEHGVVNLTDEGLCAARIPPSVGKPGSPILHYDEAARFLLKKLNGEKRYQEPSTHFWKWVNDNREAQDQYLELQTHELVLEGEQVIELLEAYNLLRSSILDIGGGNGALARQLVDAGANRVGVLESPWLADRVSELNGASGTYKSIKVYAGDFFSGIPAGYHVAILNSVLSDFDLDGAKKILSTIGENLIQGSLLIVSELTNFSGDRRSDLETELSLYLNTGALRRSPEEWTHLVSTSGFRPVGEENWLHTPMRTTRAFEKT